MKTVKKMTSKDPLVGSEIEGAKLSSAAAFPKFEISESPGVVLGIVVATEDSFSRL